jgi:hypothetical protein
MSTVGTVQKFGNFGMQLYFVGIEVKNKSVQKKDSL